MAADSGRQCMATVSSQDTPKNNGKPGAPVPMVAVRQAAIAAGDSEDRLWHRDVPAWVISGGIHLFLMAAFLVGNYFFGARVEATPPENQIVETKLEDSEQKQNFENTDVGLDPTKETNYNVDRIENISVP